MLRRLLATAVAGMLAVGALVAVPASAQSRNSRRDRVAPQRGGYQPLMRTPVGTPLVQWGSPFQQLSSPLHGLPSPLRSPAPFFQVPGASYHPLVGTYQPLSSGYRPLGSGYAPLSR
jgi:hypothetical protein